MWFFFLFRMKTAPILQPHYYLATLIIKQHLQTVDNILFNNSGLLQILGGEKINYIGHAHKTINSRATKPPSKHFYYLVSYKIDRSYIKIVRRPFALRHSPPKNENFLCFFVTIKFFRFSFFVKATLHRILVSNFKLGSFLTFFLDFLT